jgi:UDP-N-acetylmuramyl pentapeptide synthase
MKKILQGILYILSRATLRRYHPTVIAITGNVGKTSAREATYAVLKHRFSVRTGIFNYNNEIGVPLTILNLPHYSKNIFGWIAGFVRALKNIIIFDKTYPKFLLLEMGADRPGDIAYLASLTSPFIGVITAIGEIPVHVEFFSGPKALADEKSNLIKVLPFNGYAIVNADDEALLDAGEKTAAHFLTFGFDEHASGRISNLELTSAYDSSLQREVPNGIRFTFSHEGIEFPLALTGAFGKPQAYAAAVAAMIGLKLHMQPLEIQKALEWYIPSPGRLRLIRSIKNSFVLDDTYNSSPAALHAALETLRDLPGKRKIAVIGDMLELGDYSEAAHRIAGDQAAECADLLITVGPRAKFIAEEAKGGLENKKALNADQVFSFDTALEAGRALDPLIQPGDLILVKGSQGMRMERVVEEVMAEPMKAPELLVRQSEYWKKKA